MSADDKARRRVIREVTTRVGAARGEALAAARQRDKDQRARRRKVIDGLKPGPATVPALAQACGLDPADVLRIVATLRRYGRVAEDELDGSHPRYRLLEAEEGGE